MAAGRRGGLKCRLTATATARYWRLSPRGISTSPADCWLPAPSRGRKTPTTWTSYIGTSVRTRRATANRWPKSARSPASSREPVASLPGTFSFRFVVPETQSGPSPSADKAEAILDWSKNFNKDYQSLAERVHAVIDELRGRIAETRIPSTGRRHAAGLRPHDAVPGPHSTSDHFAVMAAFGTYGNDAAIQSGSDRLVPQVREGNPVCFAGLQIRHDRNRTRQAA